MALAPDEASKREIHILSRDEFAHAELLRRGIEYAQAHPDFFGETVFSEQDLAAIIENVQSITAAIAQKTVSYASSLRQLADLEKNLYRIHMSHLADIREPSLKKLFESLAAGDKTHVERILRMIESLA
jgi:rubrerythrin